MMTRKNWTEAGQARGWVMPMASPLWKRLPVIRHIRALMAGWAVYQHEDMWIGAGYFPSLYDSWVVSGIWYGMDVFQVGEATDTPPDPPEAEGNA